MSLPHTTVHKITVDAAAEDVYAVVADATSWPTVFPPTVHVEQVLREGDGERLRLHALAHGRLRSWTSWRTHHPDELRVTFRQEIPAAPVTAMSGAWVLVPDGVGRTGVSLLHEFEVADGDPELRDLVERAVDQNSEAELEALRRAVEGAADRAERTVTFVDSVDVAGPTSVVAGRVYAFLDRAEQWPQRLPHVAALDLTEEVPGRQHLRMDTRAPDGSLHTTESVRLTVPRQEIVYKQTSLPPVMEVHTGRWEIESVDGGVRVSSHHTVVLDAAGVAAVLGPDAPLSRARELVRESLGANSRTTLRYAKEHAER